VSATVGGLLRRLEGGAPPPDRKAVAGVQPKPVGGPGLNHALDQRALKRPHHTAELHGHSAAPRRLADSAPNM